MHLFLDFQHLSQPVLYHVWNFYLQPSVKTLWHRTAVGPVWNFVIVYSPKGEGGIIHLTKSDSVCRLSYCKKFGIV